ncbi:MAG: serine/threonine-protein kinase [Vicinamibacterales bacterium]
MTVPPAAATEATRFVLIESLFHDACELASDVERTAWLDARGLDADIRREVDSLLSARQRRERCDRTAQPEATDSLPTWPYGSYVVVNRVGRGGMSVVYRARRADGHFEQTVAVKVLAPHLVEPAFLRRFERERRLLASLSHHHVARLLDGGVSSHGEPFLVTEFIDGLAIDRHADAHTFGLRARVRLVVQVCEALDYAHRQLIVHGDVKPGNVLVDGAGHVKLLDFGTAVLTASDATVTATRERTLTPRYASPEQLRGERIAVASDVYSLGLLLYKLLTGSLPFGDSGSIVEELSRASGHAEMTEPAALVTPDAARLRAMAVDELRRALKGDLTAILARALAYDPHARYPSVREMADDLERYLTDRPVTARGRNRIYRVRRFVRRHRLRLAVAACVGLAIGGLSAYGVRQYGRAQQRLIQIRELNESFLTDIYSQVASLPGSTRARLLIVERAQRNLDEVFADNADDPRLRAALAQAYIQLADTQGEPFAISFGNSGAALVNYRKAESLIRENDNALESMALLARARQGVVEVLIRAGEYEEAARMAERAIEPARHLWLQAPPGFDVAGRQAGPLYIRMHMLLGHALLRLADLTRDVAGVRRALTQFELTVSLARDVRLRDPILPDLAGRYSQYVGYAYELLGDFTGSAESYRAGREAHRLAANASAERFRLAPNALNKREAADGLEWFGWAQATCGDYDEAIASLELALTQFEELATENPDSQELALDLANAHFRLGAVEGFAHREAAARAHLLKADAMVPMPARVTAMDRETVVLIARIGEHLSAHFTRVHEPDAALSAINHAIAAVSDGHSVPDWRVRELQHQRDTVLGDDRRPRMSPPDAVRP